MARGEVFVDTSGLYALVDRRDSHHAVAREIVVGLVKTGNRMRELKLRSALTSDRHFVVAGFDALLTGP